MPENKAKLTDQDWEILFGHEEIILGNSVIYIKPLSVEQISELLLSFRQYLKELETEKQERITLENVLSGDSVVVWIQKVPKILSDIISLDEEDIKRLPASKLLLIINKVLSLEDELVKNFSSLASLINQAMGERGSEAVLVKEQNQIQESGPNLRVREPKVKSPERKKMDSP